MKIAVTGAGGFIGRRLIAYLAEQGHETVRVSRSELHAPHLSGVDVLIHCAGIAHESSKQVSDAEMTAVNHRLPLTLAQRARDAGVQRFIFVSTINVVAGHASPLKVDMAYQPLSAYGASKARAEQSLLQMGGIEIVIARPALVYGADARGNMHTLLKLCDSPMPLPLGCADNRRSFVSLSNVVRALAFLTTAGHSSTAGKIFHLADPKLRSVRELVTDLRRMMNRAPKLLPVPRALMRVGLVLAGKKAIYQQLFENLIVDGHDLEGAGFMYQDGQPDIEAMVSAYLTKKAG